MKSKYSNTAFLTELLVNIIVFSVSCAVLAGLFVQAFQMARSSSRRNLAAIEMYAVFQQIKAEGWDCIRQRQQPDGSYLLAYDENWRQTGDEAPAYTIKLEIDEASKPTGVLTYVTAEAFSAAGEPICDISTTTYQPKPEGDEP